MTIPGQLTILVVDDEIQSVAALGMILEQESYNVLKATSGEECLDLLQKEKIDIVLLDVSMPGIDGFETLQRIRNQKRTQNLPVIFLTGHMRDSKYMERGFSLGVNEYLVKPVESSELLVRVKSILRMSIAEKQVKQLQNDFFSMLVHDLRGPLSAVSVFTQLMLEGPNSDEKERVEMLKIMDSACDYMLGIINNILDISKFESDYVTLNCEESDMQVLIARSTMRLKPLAVTRSIQFTIGQPEGELRVRCDPQKIEQVLDNLIGNAVKFTNHGGAIAISARIENHPVPNGTAEEVPHCVVQIRDNGIGIPSGELNLIFDKYRQVRTSKTSSAKGTGLGLAICKSIIDAHNGQIFVESLEGQGSLFSFQIPVDQTVKI